MSTKKRSFRPYQIDAIQALENCLKKAEKTRTKMRSLVSLPTGGGKTFVVSEFLEKQGWTNGKSPSVVFWTAHLEELLAQTVESELRKRAKRILYWNAKEKTDLTKVRPGDIVIVSIMSARTFTLPLSGALSLADGNFTKRVLVVDETHREAAKSYRAFEQALRPHVKIGLTATPYRLDKKLLGYDEVAYHATLMDLANQGWLARPTYVKVSTDRRYELAVQGSDFTKLSLANIGNDGVRTRLIARHYYENKDLYGKTIAFCPSIKASEDLSDELTRLGIKSAAISSASEDLYRRIAMEAFRKGQVDVLTNVQLFTEGFDDPDIKTIIMARPTLSKTLWLQAIGRGARVNSSFTPPCKDQFFVVDFVDNTQMYPLVAESYAVELLDQKPSKSYKEYKKIEEIRKQITSSKSTSSEKVLLRKIDKKGKLLNLAGIITVVNLFKSKKTKSKVVRAYPLFKEEHRYFKAATDKLQEIYFQNKSLVYPFIESSYGRIGHKTELSAQGWKDIMWAFKAHLDVASGKDREFDEPLVVKYYVDKGTLPSVDPNLVDMSEPLSDKKDEFKDFIDNKRATVLKKVGCKLTFVDIHHTTIMLQASQAGASWFYWRMQLTDDLARILEEKLSPDKRDEIRAKGGINIKVRQ